MEHFEGLGDKWLTLVEDPEKDLAGVLQTIIAQGGLRDCWEIKKEDNTTMLMAWPETGFVRAAAIFSGEEGNMQPFSVTPLIEGPVNDLTFQDSHAWENGFEGDVLATVPESNSALWFYDPLFFRDKLEFTPEVTFSFTLSGLAYGVRRALLDEMSVTEGPNFEAWAEHWLKENPDKKRIDVPPLKIPLQGMRILQPAQQATIYQARVPISQIQTSEFGPEGAKETIYHLLLQFGENEEKAINILVHAAKKVFFKNYEPKEGDEIDIIFWLQGRMLD